MNHFKKINYDSITEKIQSMDHSSIFKKINSLDSVTEKIQSMIMNITDGENIVKKLAIEITIKIVLLILVESVSFVFVH
jgi:hypothetical protein